MHQYLILTPLILLSCLPSLKICVKRGPLGACTKTEIRTAENDNDKATKYFNDPQEALKERYSASQFQKLEAQKEENANELISKLKQQSVDNKEKNDKIVRARTLQNDMVSIGNMLTSITPFSN